VAGRWDLRAATAKYQGLLRFHTLADRANHEAQAVQYGRQLVRTVLKDDIEALDHLAWSLVDPNVKKPVTRPYAELALLAAQRADALARGKEPDVADTLAAVYFALGTRPKRRKHKRGPSSGPKGSPRTNGPECKPASRSTVRC
jgi:hypothetical protein